MKNNKAIRKSLSGLFVIGIGVFLLLDKLAIVTVPHWLFSWKTFLIALGLFIGIGHSFRSFSWIFIVLIGSIFLIDDIYPGIDLKNYIFPLIVILAGLFILLRPRFSCNQGCERMRRFKQKKLSSNWREAHTDAGAEDFIEAVSVLGGIKKNILSKHFIGGEVVAFLGGIELNLSQADMENSTATLEVTQVFGGTRIIIPQHWEVKSDLVSIFGGIEDKRSSSPSLSSGKILILKGTSVFGGIDIRSY